MASSPRPAPMAQLGVLLANRGAVAGARVRDTLAGAGLSTRSAYTLMHLADGPVNQQALIDLLQVDPSALVAILNELESLGLASRQRDTADRRRHIVTMTAAGADTLEAVESVLDKTDDDLFTALSPTERDQLRQLLTKINTGACDESC
ncbi:MarR family winged helix-turn-helix transcriptional regulator [Micromonosporaceae bacterium Da 78-11]